VTQFRDGVARLVDATEREITALYTRFSGGAVGRSEFVALSAATIARARVQGIGLADLALTAEVIKQLRTRAAPLGLTPPNGDNDRLATSVLSVLDADVGFEGDELARSQSERLARLARDSSAEAAVWGYGIGMQQRGARGWIRVTDMNPCRVCSGLADGIVRSPRITMKRHTGCACVQSAAFI
jgi:hypothetical protein